MLKAAERLKKLGATAIAVVTRFPDELGDSAVEEYRKDPKKAKKTKVDDG